MGRPLPPTGHQNARYRVAYHTHSGGTTLNITTRRVGSAVVAALAIFVIIAGKGALLTAGTAVAAPPTFPYPHMSVQTAQEADSPTGTLFVTVDDGTARPASARAGAVPTDGTLSRDAAYSDPPTVSGSMNIKASAGATGRSPGTTSGSGPPTNSGPASSSEASREKRPESSATASPSPHEL